MVKKAKKRLTTAVRNVAFFKWFAARKTWQKWFFVSASLVSLLAIGSGIVMYVSWHQNAERVVVESLLKTLTSSSVGIDGSLTITSPLNKRTISLKSLGNASHGQLMASLKTAAPSQHDGGMLVQGSVVYADDKVFFKVDDVQKLYNTMLENALLAINETTAANTGKDVNTLKAEARQRYETSVHPIANKLTDAWIEVAPNDITGGMNDFKQGIDCFRQVVQTISKDDKARVEMERLYEKHRFLSIKHKLNDVDGTMGYAIAIKNQRLSEFDRALGQTTVFTSAAKCKYITEQAKKTATQQLTNATATAGIDTSVFELRMRKDSHEVTSITSQSEKEQRGAKTTTQLTAKFTFDQPVTQDMPRDAVPFSDIKAAFDGAAAQAKAAQ